MNKKQLAIIVVLFAIVGGGIGFLATDIATKKNEQKNPFFRVVEIGEFEDDPAVWGKNFPLQYDSYMRTVDLNQFLVCQVALIQEITFHKIS